VLDGLNELVGLSKLDSELAALEEELAALPAKRAAAAQEQAACDARLAAAREQLTEAEQAQRRCEGEAQDKEALLAKLESQQHQIKTNEAYTALLAEMEQAREAISDAETGVLEAMEAIESARKELTSLEEQVRGVGERLTKEEKTRSEREQALRSELDQLRTRRSEHTAALDRTLMARYDKVAARRRPAVAVITGEICLGCRVDIPPQAFIEILRGEAVVTCNHCHRILIHRDQLTAAGAGG
jgi:predicted  nucleic acid-binding Zn-ribbon protein